MCVEDCELYGFLYFYHSVPTKWQRVSFVFLFIAEIVKVETSWSPAYLNCLYKMLLYAIYFYENKNSAVPLLNICTVIN